MKRLMMVCAVGALWLAGAALGGPLEVETAMNQSRLLAGQNTAAYLKVSLTGAEVERLKDRPPVNVAIVIDKSGSMSGEKIEKAKEAAILGIERLGREDIVSVVVYDNEPRVLIPATKLTNKDALIRQVRCLEAGGSTALYGGVQTAADEMRKFLGSNRVSRMILLSDGLANVGPRNPDELGRLGGRLIDEGISVTTIGIGLGYNEDLMSKLAFASDGHHYFAEDACELADLFDKEFSHTLSVVAQDVLVKIRCAEGVRPVRLLGRAGRIAGQVAEVSLNQVFGGRDKYVLLEVDVPASAAGSSRAVASVTVEYQDLKTQARESVIHSASVAFVGDAAEAEKSVHPAVMASVVEQIAVEKHELATTLRDQGQVQQAQQVLYENSAYLRSNSRLLKSEELAAYAAENEQAAGAVQDEDRWNATRKGMRQSQTARRVQQQR